MTAKCPELGHLNRHEIAKLVGVALLADDSGKHCGKREGVNDYDTACSVAFK